MAEFVSYDNTDIEPILICDANTPGLMCCDDKKKLDGIAVGANKYVHPSYTAKSAGFYKVTVDGSGHVSAATAVTKTDITNLGIPGSNTTYSDMKGATSSAAGSHGLVPAPAAGKQSSFLRGDGTWVVPTDTVYTHPGSHPASMITQDSTHRFVSDTEKNTWNAKASTAVATTSANGLMTAAMVTKLNGIADGANKYSLPTAAKDVLGGVKTTSTVTSTSGLTACPIISGVPYYKDTNTTYSLGSFGVTASAAELNYTDGVTSNIQTQLNTLAGKISTLETNYASMLAKLKTAVFWE